MLKRFSVRLFDFDRIGSNWSKTIDWTIDRLVRFTMPWKEGTGSRPVCVLEARGGLSRISFSVENWGAIRSTKLDTRTPGLGHTPRNEGKVAAVMLTKRPCRNPKLSIVGILHACTTPDRHHRSTVADAHVPCCGRGGCGAVGVGLVLRHKLAVMLLEREGLNASLISIRWTRQTQRRVCDLQVVRDGAEQHLRDLDPVLWSEV